jgi:hypothetical protein
MAAGATNLESPPPYATARVDVVRVPSGEAVLGRLLRA